MSDQPPDDEFKKIEELRKMILLVEKLLKTVRPAEELCQNCEQCGEVKLVLNKVIILLAKITTVQSAEIKSLEALLHECLTAIEKIYATQSSLDELH